MRTAVALLTVAAALAGCGSDEPEPTPVQPPPQTSPEAGAQQDVAGTTATAPASPRARGAARGVRLARVGRFRSPLYVTAAPGDRRRLFVVEQAGRIVVVRGGKRLSRPFLDIRSRVQAGGERGLLGLAFDPGYARNGRFYVYYSDRQGHEQVSQFRRSTADRASAGSELTVLQHDTVEANHNGGMLAFGPDRLLYVATGDGGGAGDRHGSRGNAQDLGSPLGKLLRIRPRPGRSGFDVPGDNPFRGRTGARGEIYAYGLRNPWRFSFDRRTGDLVIGDVGQGEIEEVDFVRRGSGRGANFGWRPFEGRRRFSQEEAPGHVPPVIQHRHSDGWCSITGGYIVRDPDLPALAGRYVYGDFCKGQIYSARLKAGGADGVRALSLPGVGSIASFGEDARGRVYVVSLDGAVHRLAAR